MNDLETRLNSLEVRHKRMVRGLWVLAAIVLAGIVVLRERPVAASAPEDPREILRVKGLVIVDENGTERVWIGAPLPGQLVRGKREQRPSRQAGIVLYDDKGIERSGYVTDDKSGNVFLSLDDRTKQEAVFVSDAERGTALRLWYDKDSAEIRVDPDDPSGTPSLKLVRGGKTIYEQRPAAEGTQSHP
jgi:hypothetical protein